MTTFKRSLLTANVVDSTNEMFTRECLVKIVEEFKKSPSLPISHNYSKVVGDTYGLITNLEIEGDELMATFEFLKTPKGEQMKTLFQDLERLSIEGQSVKKFELAAGGHANTDTVKKLDVDGKQVHVWEDVILYGATMTESKVK